MHVFLPTVALMARSPVARAILGTLGASTLEQSLDAQLGLRLERITLPYDVIAIDNAERP